MTTPSTTTEEHAMTTTIKLTDTQREVLKLATQRPDGNLEPLPPTLRGGARNKVIEGLLARDLISKFHYPDRVEYYATDAGYAAVGRKRKVLAPVALDPETEAAVAAAEANWAQEKQEAAQRLIQVGVEGKPRTREHSKQATVIQMLRRPEGATVRQICEATGWQAHTVRGTFAGAFKKKLGLAITSEKPEGGERIYRIA
jgi:hypothetical protein